VTRVARHGGLGLALFVLVTACRPSDRPAQPPVGDAPAERIVTLAPHLAELAYSAGAGEKLVGAVEFSDFPPPVRSLPRVGNAFRVDYETIAALRPDLVLAWGSGNPPETLQRLRELGLRVVALEPGELADIATHIAEIGALAGTSAAAGRAADAFRARLAALQADAADLAPVRVFVQLSERPYVTVTDHNFIGQSLQLCGGRNVFGNLSGLTATVSLEAIVEAAPDVIVASDMGGEGTAPLEGWNKWRDLPAVRRGNLFTVDADLLSRPSARILDGAVQLCALLNRARGAPSAGAAAARLPEHLAAAVAAGENAREHEEQVGQAVEIAQ
jgi:iron complex transport system substrate-binding protein